MVSSHLKAQKIEPLCTYTVKKKKLKNTKGQYCSTILLNGHIVKIHVQTKKLEFHTQHSKYLKTQKVTM